MLGCSRLHFTAFDPQHQGAVIWVAHPFSRKANGCCGGSRMRLKCMVKQDFLAGRKSLILR